MSEPGQQVQARAQLGGIGREVAGVLPQLATEPGELKPDSDILPRHFKS